MTGIRVHELAREVGVESKILVDMLAGMGYPVKSHSSSIENHLADRLRRQVKLKGLGGTAVKKKKAPAKPAEETKKAAAPVGKKPKAGARPAAKKPAEKPEELAEAAARRSAELAEARRAEEERARKLVESEDERRKASADARRKADELARSKAEEQRKKREDAQRKAEEIERQQATAVRRRAEEEQSRRERERFTKEEQERQRAIDAKKREEAEKRRKAEEEERELRRMIDEEERAKAAIEARRIVMDEATTVKEFAEKVRLNPNEVIMKLIAKGIMATVNQTIDVQVARALALEMGFEIKTREEAIEEEVAEEVEDAAELEPRAPVVTVMGHVDHGKTSLLDAIRKTRVTETEAGGITQKLGAYTVKLDKGMVVFLDTPGHEAFTAMRARGASVTDIVVLVVAADDGVMPQTLEAIHHARAAGVPIVVAVNKIDKPGANPEKVKQELAQHGVQAEDWGGQAIFCDVSAKQKTGIEHLLDMLLLQAEVLELKANPKRMAYGAIIESKLDKGRGPVATVLVQKGTLKVGDCFVAGVHSGKVRAIIDDHGRRRQEAGPSTPVEVLGFGGVPPAGETLMVVENERKANQIAARRQETQRAEGLAAKGHIRLETLHASIAQGSVKELNIIVKADFQGSIEAVAKAIEDLQKSAGGVRINILHGAVGGITETDISLAAASEAIVIGFNVRPAEKARAMAEEEGVDVRLYSVIYNAIDDIRHALEGMLEPEYREVVTGRADVREIFNITKVGVIAGCMVTSGKITRAAQARLIRDSVVVHTGKLGSLRRFKDDVKEVGNGYECGIGLEKYNDLKAGDVIETFVTEQVERKIT